MGAVFKAIVWYGMSTTGPRDAVHFKRERSRSLLASNRRPQTAIDEIEFQLKNNSNKKKAV
jgi:hypothetical protein